MLVVDDDSSTQQQVGWLLRRSGFEVAAAADARTALECARAGFDVMLLDVHLGRDNGLDVLRVLRSEATPGAVVVITGFDTDGIEGEAHRLGAEFVDRWTFPDPVQLVSRALARTGGAPAATDHPAIMPPVLVNWAEAVAAGVTLREDPRSVAAWAHGIGKSHGVLRMLCVRARISASKSCSLVRVLRAVHLACVSRRMDPSEWLSVGDERTLERLLTHAGSVEGGAVSLEEVIRCQRLVEHHAAIGILSRVLRKQGLFRSANGQE